LHAFARRLLSEHPVEAGLPPRLEVLDEISSKVAFDRRWARFQDDLLADAGLERTILLFLAAGVRPGALRALAEAFDDNWDLVEQRVPESAPEPPSVHALFAAARRVVDDACAEPCRDPADKLRVRLDEIAEAMARLAAVTDEFALLEALGPNALDKLPSFRVGRRGKAAAYGPGVDLKEVAARVAEAGDELTRVCAEVADACAVRLGSAIRRFTLAAAGERQAEGQLEFHDLLVLSRALLRHRAHGAEVRRALHQRYRHLLLDEFQDTDPIQIELAVRIAADDPEGDAAGTAPWTAVPVTPGQLFVVGDPKQSIYRFRRADITTFTAAAERFGPEAGGVVELTANFRTTEPVIAWVNTTFDRLLSESDSTTLPLASQARYIALTPVRPPAPAGPAVSILGRQAHPGDWAADDIRRAEADEVAAAVGRALGERWPVDDGDGGWRPARPGDITVLVPARTSLPFLEDAFDRAGIGFRAESSSLVYASRAVRDLLMVLRAVGDPTDHLSIVSSLRTPLLACGDDDLFRFKVQRRGHWNYLADQPDTVPDDDPVGRGLGYLRRLYDERHWLAPSEMLGRIVHDRRALELGFAEGRPRDVWRRLRFIVDQARAWSEATGGNLRQYLRWVGLQTAEGTRVAEAILPETDDDAVRIMTIHSAKGLEFPVTIVSGMSTVPGGRQAPAQVVFPPQGTVGYRFGQNVTTHEYAEWAPIDEQMAFDERTRLLYVACTRARDHLVVSLHRKTRRKAPDPKRRTNAELLLDGMGEMVDALPDAAADVEAAPAPVAAPPVPPPPLAEWEAERRAALARA
ncbi:MAG: UvrD-helicase domain-containing protein, partial [Acidimicrobiales bacterium]